MSSLINRNAKFIGMTVLVLIAIALVSLLSLRLSLAQDRGSGLRNVIQRLVDQKTDIYIQFANPTSEGATDWTIPEDINYDGKMAGRRIFEEVGDDYVCAKNIGQGVSIVYCVPFSNITYVSYLSS